MARKWFKTPCKSPLSPVKPDNSLVRFSQGNEYTAAQSFFRFPEGGCLIQCQEVMTQQKDEYRSRKEIGPFWCALSVETPNGRQFMIRGPRTPFCAPTGGSARRGVKPLTGRLSTSPLGTVFPSPIRSVQQFARRKPTQKRFDFLVWPVFEVFIG